MTVLIAEPACRLHDTGPGHPEQPARFDAALAGLDGLDLVRLPAREAVEDELLLCHGRKYLQTARREVLAGHRELSTGDTAVSAQSWDVACLTAGAVLNAVDHVVSGGGSNVFCVNRPPGHHATPDRGMGFCLLNNIALGARYAQKKYRVGPVLIADWDVHHGNGTQDIFYEDGSVFFFSTHQYPWYPGTGAADETGYGKGDGWTHNCPFPAGAGRAQILGAFQDRLIPAMKQVKPELVLISAGFDSRQGDPLGNFLLTDQDFADLTTLLLEVADQYAGGRLISVLEGGYNLAGLAASARAHTKALLRA